MHSEMRTFGLQKIIITFIFSFILFSCWENDIYNNKEIKKESEVVKKELIQENNKLSEEVEKLEKIEINEVSQEKKVEEVKQTTITKEEIKIEEVKSEKIIKENNITTLSETLEICKSECWINSQNYCAEQKTFLGSSWEVTWTCRSFWKYNPWFPRCEWFCKRYWHNNINCTNADWSINRRCN
jgi:DNA gyrase/topoisomerase IV subunit A